MKVIYGVAIALGAVIVVASILEKFDKHYSLEFEYDPDAIGDLTGIREDK